MSLREARVQFTKALCQLILWCFEQGLEIAQDESRVTFRRKVRSKDGKVFFADDAAHMADSLHYLGLASDVNLYIGSNWISDGGHVAWKRIGEHWEQMGKDLGLPLTWGGRFKAVDSNHFSLAFGGRA
jgi:hypothetical protein